MKDLEHMNPITVFCWLLFAPGIIMFSMEPVLVLIALSGAACLWFSLGGEIKGIGWYVVIIFLSAIGNSLFHHNGATVLFVLNNNPVTKEAVIYGLGAGTMMVAVLWFFRSFARIMTGDKLLYVFGSAFPKLALILSMALRYIPLFIKQASKISDAQKALGLYSADNIPDRIRGAVRVFSVLVTWTLENGVVTADSMTSRGYGTGPRSRFALYHFSRVDFLTVAVGVILTSVVLLRLGTGELSVTWYPEFLFPSMSVHKALAYLSYFILAFAPALLQIKETLRWQFLQSKI